MKDFTLIFRLNNIPDTRPTPEQIKERMDWLGSIAAQNKLKDKGGTLHTENAKIITSGNIVTDGPYTEIKEFVTGYVVIQAESMDEAVELAKTNPIYKVGGIVEVREVVVRPT